MIGKSGIAIATSGGTPYAGSAEDVPAYAHACATEAALLRLKECGENKQLLTR